MSSNIDPLVPPFGTATTAGVRANFAAAKEEIEALQQAVGWCDANHSGTSQSITSSTWTQIENDATGDYCQQHMPPDIGPIWDAATNSFDFSTLPLYTMIDIRLDLALTTTALNQVVDVAIKFGVGSASEFQINWETRSLFKSAGVKPICCYNGAYIGSADIRDYPAQVMIWTDNDATVTVNGWYSRIIMPIFTP